MPRRQPSLNIAPPKMAHGDAERMYDWLVTQGLNLVPWQFDFLNRLETASMNKQFGEIMRSQPEVQPDRSVYYRRARMDDERKCQIVKISNINCENEWVRVQTCPDGANSRASLGGKYLTKVTF